MLEVTFPGPLWVFFFFDICFVRDLGELIAVCFVLHPGPVAQKVDKVIHWIRLLVSPILIRFIVIYQVDCAIQLSNNRDQASYLCLDSIAGFMMNLCTVALQLCDSFLLSKGKVKYKQIEPYYCTSRSCRLRFDNERTLAGGHIG